MLVAIALAYCTALSWQTAAVTSRLSKPPVRYEGTLLGVHAIVFLHKREERAVITLRGLPLGGSISGTAVFEDDGVSVKLDPHLRRALKRRHVQIEGAGALYNDSEVWVLVKLPLGLGRHTISLRRKQ